MKLPKVIKDVSLEGEKEGGRERILTLGERKFLVPRYIFTASSEIIVISY